MSKPGGIDSSVALGAISPGLLIAIRDMDFENGRVVDPWPKQHTRICYILQHHNAGPRQQQAHRWIAFVIVSKHAGWVNRTTALRQR